MRIRTIVYVLAAVLFLVLAFAVYVQVVVGDKAGSNSRMVTEDELRRAAEPGHPAAPESAFSPAASPPLTPSATAPLPSSLPPATPTPSPVPRVKPPAAS